MDEPEGNVLDSLDDVSMGGVEVMVDESEDVLDIS